MDDGIIDPTVLNILVSLYHGVTIYSDIKSSTVLDGNTPFEITLKQLVKLFSEWSETIQKESLAAHGQMRYLSFSKTLSFNDKERE